MGGLGAKAVKSPSANMPGSQAPGKKIWRDGAIERWENFQFSEGLGFRVQGQTASRLEESMECVLDWNNVCMRQAPSQHKQQGGGGLARKQYFLTQRSAHALCTSLHVSVQG